jgi:hypothetical protein
MYGLLCFSAVWLGENLTLRRNISPPSSGLKINPSNEKAEIRGNLSLLFVPEDGGDIFIYYIGFSRSCMMLQHRTVLFIHHAASIQQKLDNTATVTTDILVIRKNINSCSRNS